METIVNYKDVRTTNGGPPAQATCPEQMQTRTGVVPAVIVSGIA